MLVEVKGEHARVRALHGKLVIVFANGRADVPSAAKRQW
jgi:hypothetical protein